MDVFEPERPLRYEMSGEWPCEEISGKGTGFMRRAIGYI